MGSLSNGGRNRYCRQTVDAQKNKKDATMLLVWIGLAAIVLGVAGLLFRSLHDYRIPTL